MPIERTIITEWTCDHRAVDPDGFSYWVKRPNPKIANPAKAAQEDWDFALKYLARKVLDLDDPATYDYPDHVLSLQLCDQCRDQLPSFHAREKAREEQIKKQAAEPDTSKIDELRERIEAGEALYLCSGCSEYKDEGDLVPLRECSRDSCGEVFDGNEGRNCPSCNSPFTRRLADMACPDCLDPDSLPEPATLESLGAQAR